MYKKLPVGSMDLSGLWKRNSNGIPSWTNRLEWPVGIQWSNGEARLPRIWSNALDMFGWFDWWIWLMSGYVCFFLRCLILEQWWWILMNDCVRNRVSLNSHVDWLPRKKRSFVRICCWNKCPPKEMLTTQSFSDSGLRWHSNSTGDPCFGGPVSSIWGLFPMTVRRLILLDLNRMWQWSIPRGLLMDLAESIAGKFWKIQIESALLWPNHIHIGTSFGIETGNRGQKAKVRRSSQGAPRRHGTDMDSVILDHQGPCVLLPEEIPLSPVPQKLGAAISNSWGGGQSSSKIKKKKVPCTPKFGFWDLTKFGGNNQ